MSGQVRTGHARSGQVGFPRASHPRGVCFLGPATRPIRTSLRSLTRRPSRTRRLLWSVQAARTVVMVSCTAHARWSRFRGCPTHAHAEFVRGRLRAECAGLGASNSGVGPRTLQFRVWGALPLSSAPPCPLLFPLLRSSSLLLFLFSPLLPPSPLFFPLLWPPFLLPSSSSVLLSSPRLLPPSGLLSPAPLLSCAPLLLHRSSSLIRFSPLPLVSAPLLLSSSLLSSASPLLRFSPLLCSSPLPPFSSLLLSSPVFLDASAVCRQWRKNKFFRPFERT